ncbi:MULTISPECIES: TonB-dependent siderophore receptor [Pseudomonas]|uniref:TonB-dependent receptor n=1 Tax=Pseudomonas putida S13.1.2 TaxID=1384061 RepID=A0AAU8RXW2_PSEPU|nr:MULTISPECIES: TonB-dependent receptor [Pseudomonas]AJQ47682.1 TonB-dependent receptor [Pseudomonas putida S13.1.2]
MKSPIRALTRSAAHGLYLAVRLALCTAPLAVPASALAEQSLQRYDIATGPLGEALGRFAQASATPISFESRQVQGLTSPGVHGSFTIDDGFAQLLSGSGLVASPTEDGYQLQQAAPVTGAVNLAATTIAGNTPGSITEDSGSYTTGSTNTATKMALSLRETPQSVTVITRKKMDDQNIQNLDDIARTATGITLTKIGTDRSTYYARGFEISDLQYDGIPTNISENYSMDVMSTSNMALYDRVEVVRGANGLMQGTGNPSAAINLVRKRPTQDFRLGAELGAGSWDNYRSQVDVSGPLTATGNIRGRAVAYYNNANSYRDGAERDNQLLYLVGEADLNDSTVLTLGATLQKDNQNGYDWGGLNTRSDGSFYPLSRSTNLNGKWAHLDRNNYTLFGDVTHKFDNEWTLTLAMNAIWSNADFLSAYPSRVSGDNYRMTVSQADYEDTQFALDLYATGPFELFGRRHQLMLGANSRQDEFTAVIKSAVNNPTITITDFDYSALPSPILNAIGSDYNYKRKERGLYGASRFSLTDDLSLILGTRVSWSDYEVASPYTNDRYRENGRLVPYAGLVLDLDKHHSWYASYTEIYKTQSYYGVGNTLLDPIEGDNYETGIKGEYFDGRLNTTLAIFQTNLENMPEALSVSPTCGVTGTSKCYEAGAKVRNRGFELEISGEPLENWNLSAGYTYSDPEYVAGSSKGSDYYRKIPRRLLKVSTDYRLPGALDQWRVGGDVYAQSRTAADVSGYAIKQGGYALLNLHAHYQINQQFSVQYNLNNALDKVYYQSLPTSNNFGGLYYGDPRNVAVTLRYQY